MPRELISGVIKQPNIELLYGVPGIGKTTLISKLPNMLLIDLENGSNFLDVKRVKATSFNDLLDVITWIGTDEQFKLIEHVAIDTLTEIDKFIISDVCKENEWETIEEPGFGKGYPHAYKRYNKLLTYARALVAKGKSIYFIGHSMKETFASPTSEPYDRYVPQMMGKFRESFIAAMDDVYFYCDRVSLLKTEAGKKIAKSSGDREIFTGPSPAYIAKNRRNLDAVIINPTVEEIFL